MAVTELKSAPKKVANPPRKQPAPAPDSTGLPNSPAASQISLTPDRVIYLQRTIGNAATVRLLAQQRQSEVAAVDTSAGPQSGDLWIQRFPTSSDVAKRSSSKSKPKKGSLYDAVLAAVEAYNVVIKTNVPVKLSDRQGAVQGNGYSNYLTKIVNLAQEYITKHDKKKKQDRPETVTSFKTLVHEVYLERDALAKVVKDATYDDPKNTVSWKDAILQTQSGRSKLVMRLASELGLTASYLENLNPSSLGHLGQAHDYMKQNYIQMARVALNGLQATQPAEFPLLRSILFRVNIQTIRPDFASAVENQSFRQTDNNAQLGDANLPQGVLSMKDTAAKHLAAYEGDKSFGASKKDMETWLRKNVFKGDKLTSQQQQEMDARIATFQKRQEWEKENVNIKDFKNLKEFEKSAAAGYSTDYRPFNNPMREDIMGTGNQHFDAAQLSKIQNVISALNGLPPFVGKSYRHDSMYAGFSELNQVGSITSDLGFFSSTRETSNLRKIPGSGAAEVLILIEGKTGRFFKPISQYNVMLAMQPHDDENEVLFKPGTRFRVVRRFEKADFGTMDADLISLLNQDQLKNDIKLIVHKVEV